MASDCYPATNHIRKPLPSIMPIAPIELQNLKIDELNTQQMIFIHLQETSVPITLKHCVIRSTLSFICENVSHGMCFDKSKSLMPIISMCSILDQLGVCYNRIDIPEPRFQNGIKRALYYFGEFDENNVIIDIIYALRNGLTHNVSLTSYDKFKRKYYHFRYDKEIESIYKLPELEWNGNYETLDTGREKFTTLINVENFESLVFACVRKAEELNQDNQLELRLSGGIKQLFFDYMRTVEK